jgi:hypothetical protein
VTLPLNPEVVPFVTVTPPCAPFADAESIMASETATAINSID